VVVTNRSHGILIFNKPVPVLLIASPPTKQHTKTGGYTGDKKPMLNNKISRIILWDTGRCSFEIRKIHADFAYQS
jgi:hypothetical protein